MTTNTSLPRHLTAHLDRATQSALLGEIAAIVARAPLYRPVLPRWGTPFSVRMTNCGSLGWVSDKSGYRYQETHPVTGAPWPEMPRSLTDLWHAVTDYPHPPQACLVNHYATSAKMGLHQDRDEADFSAPVVSVSLGDAARFRVGGTTRGGPTAAMTLQSGDVVVLEGETRLAYHGIDKTFPGTSDLLEAWPETFPGGGRINLTLRRVTMPQRRSAA